VIDYSTPLGRLAGEVAIVTGATSGLGREVARLFGAEGSAVVVTGQNAERGEMAARAVHEAGGDAIFVPADLRGEEDIDRLVETTLERFGALTVLVNNAVNNVAMPDDGPVGDVSRTTFDAVLAVNLAGPAMLCQRAIPAMLAAGHGAIVNVSSRAAELGTPGLAAYTASKGGLNALARSITMDYGRQGIRCNTVQAGYIIHEHRDAGVTPARLREIEGMHLTRLSTATDVAYAVAFLASREAETISGVTLQVDGGSSMVRGRTLG
jgi:NAD(P)-dependent dehydrogenase (short-subunit alcohol dehydrogenase family)